MKAQAVGLETAMAGFCPSETEPPDTVSSLANPWESRTSPGDTEKSLQDFDGLATFSTAKTTVLHETDTAQLQAVLSGMKQLVAEASLKES